MFNKGETMPDNKEKLRSEIDDKYKWDLTLIYKTIEDFEKDYKKAKEKIEKVSSYKDKYLNMMMIHLDYLINCILMHI